MIPPTTKRRSRLRRLPIIVGAAVLLLTVALFRPERSPQATPTAAAPFAWDAAQVFAALERDFLTARAASVNHVATEVRDLLASGTSLLERVASHDSTAPLEALAQLERLQFDLAARAAAHPELLDEVARFLARSRIAVMRAAREWSVHQDDARAAVYRAIYGGRTALEEALVQAGTDRLPSLVLLEDIPSSTPSIEVAGVRIHSGDMVLSRGGAPTSALIARGNDFPGNFSHVALVHVDSTTGVATVMESLIERGAVLTTPERYLEDKKHRILVLRLRADHPTLQHDPLAPHRAASAMLERVRARGARYDFAMDWRDPDRMFCSEVVYHAYQTVGLDLWAVGSTMSAPGVVAWLASLGVRHFSTIIPSDLEYDPRLGAVAEWRNVAGLRDYRRDNALLDALLEGADRGDRLGYPIWSLGAARLVKTWSTAQALVGGQPVIPTGMSAGAALRVQALVERVHPVLLAALERSESEFQRAQGYEPPYWTLVELARSALAEHRAALAPALRMVPVEPSGLEMH